MYPRSPLKRDLRKHRSKHPIFRAYVMLYGSILYYSEKKIIHKNNVKEYDEEIAARHDIIYRNLIEYHF